MPISVAVHGLEHTPDLDIGFEMDKGMAELSAVVEIHVEEEEAEGGKTVSLGLLVSSTEVARVREVDAVVVETESGCIAVGAGAHPV